MKENKMKMTIINKDGFQFVYIGTNFYKELTVCSLSELMFVLINSHSKSDHKMILEEFIKRLEDNGYPQMALLIKSVIEAQDKFVLMTSEDIFDYIDELIEKDSNIEIILNTPSVIPHGFFGLSPALLTQEKQSEVAVALEIRENKIKEITKNLKDAV